MCEIKVKMPSKCEVTRKEFHHKENTHILERSHVHSSVVFEKLHCNGMVNAMPGSKQ